jgi:hypothetical protein
MQFDNKGLTKCPACHAQWRKIEIIMQACETCLYIAMPLPADTVDVDRPEMTGKTRRITPKMSVNDAINALKERVKRP